jgi:hypothetical protein
MPEVTANEPNACNESHPPEEITEWAMETFGRDFFFGLTQLLEDTCGLV